MERLPQRFIQYYLDCYNNIPTNISGWLGHSKLSNYQTVQSKHSVLDH